MYVFEGVDNCGKSTLIKKMSEKISPLYCISFPSYKNADVYNVDGKIIEVDKSCSSEILTYYKTINNKALQCKKNSMQSISFYKEYMQDVIRFDELQYKDKINNMNLVEALMNTGNMVLCDRFFISQHMYTKSLYKLISFFIKSAIADMKKDRELYHQILNEFLYEITCKLYKIKTAIEEIKGIDYIVLTSKNLLTDLNTSLLRISNLSDDFDGNFFLRNIVCNSFSEIDKIPFKTNVHTIDFSNSLENKLKKLESIVGIDFSNKV